MLALRRSTGALMERRTYISFEWLKRHLPGGSGISVWEGLRTLICSADGEAEGLPGMCARGPAATASISPGVVMDGTGRKALRTAFGSDITICMFFSFSED